ncbi:MAG: TPR end-of-group domain-containing protein, partial [Bacteroidia bacterium]
MKKILFLLPALLFIACNGSKQSSKSLEQKQVPQLFSEKNLYVIDSVKFYASKASPDQVTRGKLLFYQGLDQYLNQNKPEEGMKLFIQSVLLNPTGKTYYYLANSIIDKGDTAHVNDALILAFTLEYEQQDEIDYTYSRMYALLNDTARALDQLDYAFQNGFINKKRIESDKCFDKIRGLMRFEAMMVSNFKDEVALKAKVFRSFLAEFPEASLPLEIQKDSMGNMNGNFINYDYSTFIIGMEDGKFSR